LMLFAESFWPSPMAPTSNAACVMMSSAVVVAAIGLALAYSFGLAAAIMSRSFCSPAR